MGVVAILAWALFISSASGMPSGDPAPYQSGHQPYAEPQPSYSSGYHYNYNSGNYNSGPSYGPSYEEAHNFFQGQQPYDRYPARFYSSYSYNDPVPQYGYESVPYRSDNYGFYAYVPIWEPNRPQGRQNSRYRSYPSYDSQAPDDCSGSANKGRRYAVWDVCFAYYECVDYTAKYRQCDDRSRYDPSLGRCVEDYSCTTGSFASRGKENYHYTTDTGEEARYIYR
ncbi:prisilkin-39-like [Aplysia californica]|uniref:Prisilkin-39-like n=1 Tax=Aplysia californica TaxID=6500 RepID=A0ABM1VWA1_APLCA|nr:prisilkin-39-like [Aplysia californica]